MAMIIQQKSRSPAKAVQEQQIARRAFRQSGTGTGVPIFLKQRARGYPGVAAANPEHLRQTPDTVALEQEADQIAAAVDHGSSMTASHVADADGRAPSLQRKAISAGTAKHATPVGTAVDGAVRSRRGQGSTMPEHVRSSMRPHLGADFGEVRIHTDTRAVNLAQALGANAFTSGSDIFFNQGRYEPESAEGQRLLAHELTHVVQQGGESNGQVQFDLMMSLPTALGGFDVNMATQGAPRPGVGGTIEFHPDPTGPYSAEIGLVQTVNITDVAGRTTTAESPMDWRNVGTGAEGNRMQTMTTGADVAPAGWHVDILASGRTQGENVTPNYQENFPTNPQVFYGWLRSPTDVRQASLVDFPGTNFDSDFEFETVAKATDTQTVYGVLEWGFSVRSGATQGEFANAFGAESATFNEALEHFRGFYTHEPVVFYFETNVETPMSGEEWKLDDIVSYMTRYPDVLIDVEGFADERGGVAYNRRLARRRANSVQALLAGRGIDASRMSVATRGETTQFAPGSRNEGTWRANRRVQVTFNRTASTPTVLP